MYEIRHYLSPNGQDLTQEWIKALRDPMAKTALVRRINRLALGNFGDHRFCRDGVWELRIDAGPGYRVYYALAGNQIVLLLCGGDKRTQSADIESACACWQDWQRRPDNERYSSR